MKPEFRELRLRQLARSLEPYMQTKQVVRPRRGWIRAIREAAGITLAEIARKLGTSRGSISQLEGSETDYRITLKSLRDVADALGCELVYALVPKTGDIHELATHAIREKVAENVRAVEHTMALEDQAVGGVDAKINEERDRILKPGQRRK